MSFTLEWEGENLKRRVYLASKKNVKEASERVAKGMRKRVPKDTGGLKESIEVKEWENKGVLGAYVQAGEEGKEHIATFVELGTPGDVYTGGDYKGRKRKPLPKQPYLRPALRAEKKRFAKSFKDAL